METKASIVVMSHLSDAEMCTEIESHKHINFAKFIILKTGGDLTKEIDPEKMYEDFCKKQ